MLLTVTQWTTLLFGSLLVYVGIVSVLFYFLVKWNLHSKWLRVKALTFTIATILELAVIMFTIF